MRHAFVLVSDPGTRVPRHDVGDAIVLDPTTTTVVGRAPDCTVRLDVPSVNRKNCGIQLDDDGHWLLTDYGGTNGVFINGRRITREHALRDGDHLDYEDVRLHFAIIDDDPLARVAPLGPGLVLGDAPVDRPGRRRALLRLEGETRLVTVLSRPVGETTAALPGPGWPPVLARFEAEHLQHLAFADVRGVPVVDLPDAERVTLGFSSSTNLWPWRDTLVATFDGDVWLRPTLREVAPLPAGPVPDRAVLAARVRGLFPEAWAREQALREQVGLLDDEGLAWLLRRSRES